MPYAVDTPPAVIQVVRDAVAAAMPKPATSMPPGVGVDGATGTDTTQYALANHTHATSVQRFRMSLSATGTAARWTFAKPYDPGVVPVVNCTPQITSGGAPAAVANIVGSPTNTYVDVAVFNAQPTVGVLGISVTVTPFAFAPKDTVVNCQAGKPTQ